MINKQITAIALLVAAAGLAHAQDAPKTDPGSGKNCVSFFSSESPTPGLIRMNFRNICDSQFQIEIMAAEKTRKGTINAGTPEKPAKAYVTCRSDDGCEAAEWKYE